MSGSLNEEGKRLVDGARRIFEREVRAALADEDHNLVVRRSQEVVELALKGVLRMLGIDYPKAHDVDAVFARQVPRKAGNINQSVLARIQAISLWLAQACAPAFYLEADYGSADAERASEDARYVLQSVAETVQTPPNGTALP